MAARKLKVPETRFGVQIRTRTFVRWRSSVQEHRLVR